MESEEGFESSDLDFVTATLMHGRELLADGMAAVNYEKGIVSFIPEFVSSSTRDAPWRNLRLVISPGESHHLAVQSMDSPQLWRFQLLEKPMEIPPVSLLKRG